MIYISKKYAHMLLDAMRSQDEEYGTIAIDATGELVIRTLQQNDEHRWYLRHAVSRIKKYFADKNFSENDIIAWY